MGGPGREHMAGLESSSLQQVCTAAEMLRPAREAPGLSIPQGSTHPHCSFPTGVSVNVAPGSSLGKESHSGSHSAQSLHP